MDMQDKEFDQLFRSKLNDLEIEPSGAVWQGINEGLGNNKRRKIIPFLSIAASIIVLIAAGVLFMPKRAVVVKIAIKNRLTVVKPVNVTSPIAVKQQPVIIPQTNLTATNSPVHLYRRSQNIAKMIVAKQKPTAKNEQPAKANDQQVLTAVSAPKNEVKQITSVDTSVRLAVTSPALQNNATIAAVPAKKTETMISPDKATDASPVKKHKIHGIGDLLNIVVAAVDKRKDKVIEFGDSDGDGATVTAVNLGIIKLKKEN